MTFYYILDILEFIRLQILFKFSVLAGYFWQHAIRKRELLPHYHQVGVKLHVPGLASIDRHSSNRRGISLSPDAGESSSSHMAFTDIIEGVILGDTALQGKIGMPHWNVVRVGSRPPTGLCWQRWGHSFLHIFCCFAHLVNFCWILDVVNFIFLSVRYFCISINILKLGSGIRLSYLEIVWSF